MASGPITSWQIDGKQWEQWQLYFLGLQNRCRWWLQPWNEKTLAPWKKSYDNLEFNSAVQLCLTQWPIELAPELAPTHVHGDMPSKHLILYHPLLLLPSIFPSIRVFPNESVLCISWPKYWSFSFSISPSNKYSGLISFRIDWFDHLVVQRTLESLLQHHSSNASVFQYSAFFMVQLSHPLHDYWTNQSFD